MLVAWKIGASFKEAFDLNLCLEPTGGKALQAFFDQACQWLIWDQKLSVSFDRLVAISSGCIGVCSGFQVVAG